MLEVIFIIKMMQFSVYTICTPVLIMDFSVQMLALISDCCLHFVLAPYKQHWRLLRGGRRLSVSRLVARRHSSFICVPLACSNRSCRRTLRRSESTTPKVWWACVQTLRAFSHKVKSSHQRQIRFCSLYLVHFRFYSCLLTTEQTVSYISVIVHLYQTLCNGRNLTSLVVKFELLAAAI